MELSEFSSTDESLLMRQGPHPHQLFLPGSFVVLQGIPGDGLANTIETSPDYYPTDSEHHPEEEEEEEEEDADGEEDEVMEDVDAAPTTTHPLEENHFQSHSLSPPTNTFTTQPTGNHASLSPSNHTFPTNQSTTSAPPTAKAKAATPVQSISTETPSDDVVSPPSTSSPPLPGDDSFVVIDETAQQRHPHPSTDTTTETPRTRRRARQQQPQNLQAINQWNQDRKQQQRYQRQEWQLTQQQHQHQPRRDNNTTTSTATPTTNSAQATQQHQQQSLNDRDWWLDPETGYLAIFDNIPTNPSSFATAASGNTSNNNGNNCVPRGTRIIGNLPPGSTLTATKLYTFDSESLQVIHLYDGINNNRNSNDQPTPMLPSLGVIQMLQIQLVSENGDMTTNHDDSSSQQQQQQGDPSTTTTNNNNNNTSLTIGYCTYSVHGYAFLMPGIASLYMNPQIWWWRVTCKVGAFLRQGLELSSDHQCTIPYGSFVQVTRKTVNRMGLSRLRVVAQVVPASSTAATTSTTAAPATTPCAIPAPVPTLLEENNSNQPPPPPPQPQPRQQQRMAVEGWCSEFLNPLSGQRGHVVQPVPFAVPAVYRVTLPEGAVIRQDVELSSRQIGHAPCGTLLTIVQRRFSEHPQDQCVERLKLAGDHNSGWISVRLNQLPPHNRCVVELVGIDSRFQPNQPGDFHFEIFREQQQQQQQQQQSRQEEQQQQQQNGATTSIHQTTNNFSSSPLGGGGGGGDLSSIDEDTSSNEKPSRTMSSNNNNNITSTTKNGYNKRRQQVETCLICLTEERNATIVHGETGHIACCLVCARILRARGDRCPVCRLEIDSVIQHFWA